jgi:hypothetical protein
VELILRCQLRRPADYKCVRLVPVAAESHFDEWTAKNYSRLWPELFGPELLDSANASRHLEPGGYFLVENYVPRLQRLAGGETRVVFVANA